MIKADEVFNASDFESVRLNIHFANNTTHTEIRDTKKTQLIEVGEKWLVLELPAKCCNVKHNVMVGVFRREKPTKKKENETELVTITGKVLHLEDLGDERVRATIECVQYEERLWAELLGLFSKRQEEIEKFFAAVKG